MKHRTEDDLRTAFTAKAGEAPQAQDVLRTVRRRETARPARRRWLVPAVTAAAAVAIGVPLGFAVTNSNGGGTKSGAVDRGSRPADLHVLPGAPGAASSAASSAAARKAQSEAASAAAGAAIAVCRPGDVTVTVRRDAGTRAAVIVTAREGACRLARVPQVRWSGAGTTLDAVPQPAVGSSKSSTGQLPAGATATAQLTWDGPCSAPPGDLVTVDWGAGPVETHAGGANQPGCPRTSTPASLRIGAFTGLS